MGKHDTLFKRAFAVPEHAAAGLRSVLPASIADTFELSALELMPASFADPEMAHRRADLLFRAPWSGRPGNQGYLYLLLEHQMLTSETLARGRTPPGDAVGLLVIVRRWLSSSWCGAVRAWSSCCAVLRTGSGGPGD